VHTLVLAWLISTSAVAADATGFASIDDLDPELVVQLLEQHPLALEVRSSLHASRSRLLRERLTPVSSLTVGTALTTSTVPGQEVALQPQLGVSVDVVELVTYPLRVAERSAELRGARARRDAASRELTSQMKRIITDVKYRERRVRIEQQTLQNAQISADIARRQFAASAIAIDQLARVVETEAAARRQLAEQETLLRLGVVELEHLMGMTLDEAFRIQQAAK
jgi:hypothetical protein